MATQYTSLLGLALPVTGELSGTWGDTVNDAITSLLDSAVAGTTTLNTDADVTLTTTTGAANQSRQAIILWTANGTTTRNITAPAQSKIYTVINASAGTQSIVFRGVGPTAGVTVVKGESAVVAWNGSDFIKISNTGGGGSFTNVTISGTTTLSGLTASTALALNASKEVVSVTNTGTGDNVLATSPVLTTPNLGTPSAVTLTNATGLPVSTGISGLGTGVATALAVNTGTAGAFVVNGGALGTPSSGTVTNLTGTASININGTVGATTPTTGAFTTLTTSSTVTLNGGTANGVAYLNGSKVLTTGSALTFDGTTLTTVSAGINTQNTVSDTVSPTAAATNQIRMASSGFVAFRIGTAYDFNIDTYNSATPINVYKVSQVGQHTWSAGGTRIMDLTSTGLGIGTSSPTNLLTVAGSGSTPAAFLRTSSTVGAATYLNLQAYNASSAAATYASLGSVIEVNTAGAQSGALAFNTVSAAAVTERMRITSAGNVGIGTSSPTNTLSVAGNANITGNTTLGDASTDTVTVNGYMGVGGAASNAARAINIESTSLTGGTQRGLHANITGSSAATSAVIGVSSFPKTAAASFTVADVMALQAGTVDKGAGSTITNQHGVYISDQAQGTNNYGITSLVSSGSNKWNIYASGTAANYFAGAVSVGTTSTTNKLNIAGGNAHIGSGYNFTADAGGGYWAGGSGSYATGWYESSGAVLFRTSTTTRFTLGTTEAVFNDPGNDYDFRVESDTNTHALFVQGSDGNVGIGTSSPSGKLDVTGSVGTVRIETTGNKVSFTRNGANYISAAGGSSASISYDAPVHYFNSGDGATTRMTLNDSGNLGLGVTPSAWSSSWKSLQVGNSIALYGRGSGANITYLGNNVYLNASGLDTYISSDYATTYRQYLGGHAWYTAPSGTAGNAISFSQVMTLDASGRLLIGGTSAQVGSASGSIDVMNTSGDMLGLSRFTNASGGSAMYFQKSRGTSVGTNTIVQSGDSIGAIYFRGANGTGYSEAAYILAAVDGTPGASADMPGRLVFATSADGSATPTERLRIDSSGNLGIGTSSPGAKLESVQGTSGAGGWYMAGQFSAANYPMIRFAATTPNKYSSIGNNGDGSLQFLVNGSSGAVGTTAAILDTSGNLALGVTPSAWTNGVAFEISGKGNAVWNYNGNYGDIRLLSNAYYSSGFKYGGSSVAAGQYQITSGVHSWYTAPSGTAGNAISFTQAMTLDASGNLLVGTTSNTNSSKIFVLATSSNPAFASQGATGDVSNPSAIFGKFDNNTTTSQIFVRFTINNNGAGSGQITANGANTAAFGSYSDQRLKENIVDLPPQLANIMALRPVEFDYIQSEGGGHQIGFIAQNMESVYPDVVGEREDGMKMIAGWSKTEARLVKAIQEQQAIITDLRARVAALEAA